MEKRQRGVLRRLGYTALLSTTVLLLIFAIVSSLRKKSHPTQENTAQQAAYDEYRKRYDATIAALARKYNAVMFEATYRKNTIDLQEILEQTKERPMLFTNRIIDFINEEEYYPTFKGLG